MWLYGYHPFLTYWYHRKSFPRSSTCSRVRLAASATLTKFTLKNKFLLCLTRILPTMKEMLLQAYYSIRYLIFFLMLRTRAMSTNWRTGGYVWKLRNTFFSVMVTEYWPRFPRETVESPSLDILKSYLNMVLAKLLQVALLDQRCWARWPPEVSASLKRPVIL